MTTLAFLLLTSNLAPFPQTNPIEFESRAATLGQTIDRLAEKTGAKIKASPAIAHEIVLVRAKNVNLADLKLKLADAVTGTWVSSGETEYLARTPEQEKAIKAAHLALRRKYVDEALSEVKKALEARFDATILATGLKMLPSRQEVQSDPINAQARYRRERDLFAQGPRARLLNRLILACDPDALASIGPFERAVFTARPTPMQRRFDRKKLEAAFASFATEQQAWIDEAKRTEFPEDPGGRMVSDPRTQMQLSPTIDDFDLVVSRGEMTSLFNVNLVGGSFRIVLTQASFADPARIFLDAQMTPEAPIEGDPIVELSEDSKEFSERIKAAFMSRQSVPLTKRMRELMTGVETSDPLSWVVSDALIAYADSKKLNMVAALPDQAVSMAFFVSREHPLRAGGFLKALVDSGTIEKKQEGDWLTIFPANRYESALEFTPRRPTANLAKAVLARGFLDIRDYAHYAFQSKRLNRGGIGDFFLAMIDRSVLGASDRTDWNSLRLYGSFSEQVQRDLESGAKIPYSGMSIEQRKIVERITFADAIRNEHRTGGDTYLLGKYVEPTEAFPNGVPIDCTVTGRVTNNPTLVAYGKGEDGVVRPLRGINEHTIATFEANSAGDPQMAAQYGLANLVGYAVGAERLIALRVELAPGVWKESAITIAEYSPNATPVAWKDLPAPYPKTIEDAIEAIKKQNADRPPRNIPPR